MEEKLFFECEGTRVTNARFIVGNQTYAMNGVTSIKEASAPPSRTLPIGLMIVGALFLLGGSGGSILFGLILIVCGILVWRSQKTTFAVILNSASGETRALVSTDEQYIKGVIDALNVSIISRG